MRQQTAVLLLTIQALAIDWPIAPEKAITSEKDQKHPTLKEFEAENPFIYGEI